MGAKPVIVWLRRDLRLHDHAALWHALQTGAQLQPVFVFDTDILAAFPSKQDRRLSFIAAALQQIDAQLQKRGGRLLVVHGSAKALIPKLVKTANATHLFAAEDYEPDTRARDAVVKAALPDCQVSFVKDQVIFSPTEILRAEGGAYKVFTPYANSWRTALTQVSAVPYEYQDNGRYAAFSPDAYKNFTVLDASDPALMLQKIGYDYTEEALWPVADAPHRLKDFIARKAQHYATNRDFMAKDGTSRLSPYVRFGLMSVRECVRAALEANASTWLNELIWREFYATILYHFPESAQTEWNPKYRGQLDWSYNENHFKAWQEGKTGYPLVDAAMRQLLFEGWMHNRARMVVASFLTKHLRIDWRKGEAHFAQYLMDYDLASNVGGWQWAASTGTDAQPYFRVFNPVLQSEKFDAAGDYIRAYVPELINADAKAIHAPWKHPLLAPYYPPIVVHAEARVAAMEMFKTTS